MSNHEPVLLVSRHNHPRGSCQRGRMQRQRLIHRASYVVVQDLAGRVCAQKRAEDKHFYPGGWDLAAGGVMRPDETVAQGLSRSCMKSWAATAVFPLAVVLVCQSHHRVWGHCHPRWPARILFPSVMKWWPCNGCRSAGTGSVRRHPGHPSRPVLAVVIVVLSVFVLVASGPAG